MSSRFSMTVGLIGVILVTAASAEATKLLRFPDIHRDKVVFTHGGDLWIAPSKGGIANRLTAHPGLELFAKFSPDGRWIAFTGQYDGDEQVFVIPSKGGVPKQLTFYPARGPMPPRWGYDNQVYGWHPNGNLILFRSRRDSWDIGNGSLYSVARKGGMPSPLPLPETGAGVFSPDGRKLFYSPLFRDFRTWKRYQGGWAQDLYVFDLSKRSVRRITRHVRTDRDPMWIGDALYFASDRDGRLNLFRYDLNSRKISQLTHHVTWDVRWPSDGVGNQIVYELNGELRVYNTQNNRDRAISIQVPSDEIPAWPRRVSVAANIESLGLSPYGKRALIVARGDLFDVPIEHGLTRNLTHSSNAHDREAQWSPDGKKALFLSDRTGEEELWWIDLKTGQVEQLTRGSRARLYAPRWSPDGKRIAYSDKNGRIYILRLEDRRVIQIADDRYGSTGDYSWSPHGGHLAFSLREPVGFGSLHIWSAGDGKVRRITGPNFNEYSPAWDPKGNYLYYLSDRDFRPQMGGMDFNYVVNRETGIFALALRKDVPHPFPPKNDTEEAEEEQDEKEKQKAKWSFKSISSRSPIKIDFRGLAHRVARVRVDSDNYEALRVTATHLVFLCVGPWYHGRDDIKAKLEAFAIKDQKRKTLAEGVKAYGLSWDGTKALVRLKKEVRLVKVDQSKAKPDEKPKMVSLDGLSVLVNPRQEWANIFDEVWRRFRDHFYVENMHGFDWQELRARYRPLLGQVAHRSDLNYLLGEMVAELNVSHAYLQGGDENPPKRPSAALPGARFVLDQKAKKYRIAKIMRGHNQEEVYRAPLTEVGIDARVGDYLLTINGQELRAVDNPYRLLRLPADKPVELLLNRRPRFKGARRVIYRPRATEHDLLYLAWVLKNQERVDRATQGKVGYIHLPDMFSNGIREFIKWFYPQTRKHGLIVDVRGNGGGHVSELLIERLRRKLLMTSFGRNIDEIWTYPRFVLHGPMVCLINETSASDGDIFPWAFRQAGIGPLIGKRTWGGVIGISGHGPLIDGGNVFVPEYSTNDIRGAYIIEGRGVVPDIQVDNPPEAVLRGEDPQLDRAIQEVLDRMRKTPLRLPKRPKPPVKTGK